MFSAAWKTLSVATIVNCFHKAGNVPRNECERESGIDADMVNNWQHLCQKLDVEVALDDFIGVDNDATVVQELTEDEILSEILMQRNGASGDMTPEGEEQDDDGGDEHVITVTEAANVARRLRRFVMTRKGVPDRVLESSEILQEFTEKSLLKTGYAEKNYGLFYEVNMVSLSIFVFFYMCLTIILTFLMCFSVTKFRYNE
jgi:hypothetical protein